MEDPLEGVTTETNNLFYSTRLKALQVAQTLRIQENRISDNDIKTIAHENYNLFCMTEKVFEALQLRPLFQLAKTLTSNYNSLIVILLDMFQKQTLKIIALQKNPTELTLTHQSSAVTTNSQNIQIPASNSKRAKLGGVHIYNENYGRYLEDQRILEQLRIEKEQGIRKRKQELIHSMIFQELNHTTDVEETSPSDELTDYIHEMKTKGNIYNYVPYEAELQDILAYFHNAQNQANEFLIKKDKAQQKSTNPQNFSFSQIQREVQAANSRLRKELTQKLKAFMDRFRQRQQQLEACLQEKERQYQKSAAVGQPLVSEQVQTDLNLNEMIRMSELQKRQLQLTCMALEHLKSSQAEGAFRQNNLKYEINLKKKDLQKLQQQKKQLQVSIINLKKVIKLEKQKNTTFKDGKSIKQIDLKLQPSQGKNNSPQQEFKEDSRKKMNIDDSNPHTSQMSTSKKLAKTFGAGDWNRKISNDSTPLFRQQGSDVPEQESLNRTHRQLKKYARYFVDNPKPQPLKIEIQNQAQEADIRHNVPSSKVTIDFGIQTGSCPIEQCEGMSFNPNQNLKISYKTIDNEIELTSLTSLAYIDKNDKSAQSKSSTKTLNSKTATNRNKDAKQQSILKQKDKKTNEPKKEQKLAETIPKKTVQKQEIRKLEAHLKQLSISKEPYKMSLASKEAQKKQEEGSTDQTIESVQNQGNKQVDEEKEKVIEKVLQVVEQVAEQDPDSHKCSPEVSEINSHIQSPCDGLPQRKISIPSTIAHLRQLKRLKNNLSSQSISIMITPSVSGTIPQLKIHAPKQQRNAQENLLHSCKPEQQKNIASLFSTIPKVVGRISQQKRQFLNAFKIKVLESYNSGKITLEEVQNIVSVVSLSGEKEEPNHQQPCLTPWPMNHRHSLPAIDINQPIPKITKKYHHHVRHSSYSGETKQQISQDFQNKAQLEDIIHFSPIHSNFQNHFRQKHRGCKEGPICSHVMKYLQIIMRQIEGQKLRQKQSMTLHVENIGKKMEQGECFMNQQTEQRGLSRRAKENKEIRREKTLGYERRSLQKVSHSKMVELPVIRTGRVN